MEGSNNFGYYLSRRTCRCSVIFDLLIHPNIGRPIFTPSHALVHTNEYLYVNTKKFKNY